MFELPAPTQDNKAVGTVLAPPGGQHSTAKTTDHSEPLLSELIADSLTIAPSIKDSSKPDDVVNTGPVTDATDVVTSVNIEVQGETESSLSDGELYEQTIVFYCCLNTEPVTI